MIVYSADTFCFPLLKTKEREREKTSQIIIYLVFRDAILICPGCHRCSGLEAAGAGPEELHLTGHLLHRKQSPGHEQHMSCDIETSKCTAGLLCWLQDNPRLLFPYSFVHDVFMDKTVFSSPFLILPFVVSLTLQGSLEYTVICRKIKQGSRNRFGGGESIQF